MRFSYNWLKEYIKGRLPKPEKMAELLTLHSFEVEKIKKIGNDFVLDIDVLPNRACDCLSHIGVARECAALTSSKFKVQSSKFKETRNLKISKFLKVEVKDKKLCPRYTARVITDVKVKDSPKWIKKRLLACGLKPINNIVDSTNYVMLETGQPLHAFDFDKLDTDKGGSRGLKRIIVRRAKKGEKITILDGGEYELDRDVLVIAGKKEPLAIAGIKGGKIAEIDGGTQTIVLESANFNPLAIRRSSKKLSVRSDASRRFEADLDPNICEWAINRVASLIQRQARGKIAKGIIDIYSNKPKHVKIKLDLKKVEDLLGIGIPRQRISKTFKHLGLNIKEHRFNFEVEIPTWRGDLNIEEDLIEEIVRFYGYNEICSQMPETWLSIPKKDNSLFWENKIKDILVGAGFTEVYNYSFVSDKDLQNLSKTLSPIGITNPMNINQKYLRLTLVPKILGNVYKNLKNFNRFKIFELGKVYHQAASVILEKRRLTAAIVGEGSRTFYQAKGVVELLLDKLGIQNFYFRPFTRQSFPKENLGGQASNIQHSTSNIQHWHPSRTAEIKTGRVVLGTIGEVHPEALTEHFTDSKVVLFELDFESLVNLASTDKIYKSISRYPAITLDLAVIVNRHFLWANIRDRVLKEAGGLVKGVRLFDIYKGKGIPKGKISFAFHVTYQKEARTLTEREAKLVHKKIIRVLEGMGGEIRR